MTMTDEPDDLDELLSRYLDGDASESERARIESDPGLSARAARMQEAIALVGAAIDVPTFDLERIRAFALSQRPAPTPVTDLAEARRQRSGLTPPRLVAAAAAFVLLALAITAIGSRDGADDLDVATDAGDDSASFEMATQGDAGADGAAESGSYEMAPQDDGEDDSMAADELEEASDDFAEDADAVALDSPDSAADDGGAESDGDEDLLSPEEIFDRLPAELEPVSDLATLEVVIDEFAAAAVAEGRTVEPGGDLPEEFCEDVGDLLADLLPDGTSYLETAAVVVDGIASQVVIATGPDGTVVTIVFDQACAEVVVLGIDPA